MTVAGDNCTVHAEGLTKRFKNLLAVDEVSFDVMNGEVFGLLGPNGAGKTTIVRMSTGQLGPTAGRVRICGYDVWTDPLLAKDNLSVVPQSNNLDIDLSLMENLVFHAKYQGLRRSAYEPRIEELLRMMDLGGHSDDNVRELSGGTKRKATIARALIRQPRVLFLDEPTVGLDPAIRLEIWDLVAKLTRDGMSVLLTTHYMEEADRLCNRIAIMNKGRIVTHGTPAQLKSWLRGVTVVVVTNDPAKASKVFKSTFGEDRVQTNGELITLSLSTDYSVDAVLAVIAEKSISVTEFKTESANLEDVFIAVTGRKDQ